MGSWLDDDDIQGNFLSCKEGEKLQIKVKSIEKIVGGYSKFHYKKKDGSPILTKDTKEPFHHELEAEDGRILTIGAISLMSALRGAKVEGGEEIEINHSGRGKYAVRILSGEKPEADLETDLPWEDK